MMMLWMAAGAAAASLAPAGAALSLGSLAFVGFDSDGEDSFALAALADIPAGEEIYLRDEEWNGLDAFVGAGEGEVKWITPSLSAGTVVLFTFTNQAIDALVDPFHVSHGTLEATPTGANAIDLSGSGETLWAFQGSSNAPAAFLAAISTDGFALGLDGTGLTAGHTAVGLPSSIDVAEYIGPRTGELSYEAYVSMIGDAANWATADGSGDQSDSILPFDAAPGFSVAPEPGTAALLSWAGFLGLLRRRRPPSARGEGPAQELPAMPVGSFRLAQGSCRAGRCSPGLRAAAFSPASQTRDPLSGKIIE
ncbi:MAG TPA: hypothetical protein VMN36_13105 [Verrucomicrobiales bacterium]|nr:hypothetical protein [Verrucomicrobiales bacterium]